MAEFVSKHPELVVAIFGFIVTLLLAVIGALGGVMKYVWDKNNEHQQGALAELKTALEKVINTMEDAVEKWTKGFMSLGDRLSKIEERCMIRASSHDNVNDIQRTVLKLDVEMGVMKDKLEDHIKQTA